MGICYKGLTLKEAIDEKESLFEKTGYAYGLKSLELVEQDPAKFTIQVDWPWYFPNTEWISKTYEKIVLGK